MDVRWLLGIIISYPSSMSGIIVKYTGNWARKQGNQVVGFFTWKKGWPTKMCHTPPLLILLPFSFAISSPPSYSSLWLNYLSSHALVSRRVKREIKKVMARKANQGLAIKRSVLKRVCYSHIIDTCALANMKSVTIDKKRTTLMTGGFWSDISKRLKFTWKGKYTTVICGTFLMSSKDWICLTRLLGPTSYSKRHTR